MEGVFNLTTVTFDTNGGSHIPEQKLLRGETAARPDDPTRTNYIFTDWYEDEALSEEWDFSFIPEHNMTLFAGWLLFALDIYPEGDIVFFPEIVNYGDIPPKLITIFNNNPIGTGALNITLSGENPDSFILSKTNLADIEAGESDSFTVVPAQGLSVGLYSAQIIISNSGISLSIHVSFAVDPAALADIAIYQQPKLVYTHGDLLDLSDMILELVYENDDRINVPFEDFNDRSISTSLADGISLIRTVHNGASINVSYREFSVTTGNLTVEKAVITGITFPVSAPIVYQERLYDSHLTGGTTSHGSSLGSFAWLYPETLPPVENPGYSVIFTPNDYGNENYDWSEILTFTQTVTITVYPAPIGYCPVTITGPALGEIPSTSAASISSRFTPGGVTWLMNGEPWPSGNAFLPLTQYTVSITLTANANYIFDNNSHASVNGSSANVISNAGSTMVISFTFAATLNKTIAGMTIESYPNLIYTHGDALDLSWLTVLLVYDDGTDELAAFENFTSRNIGTNFENGITLSRSDYNGDEIIVSVGSLSVPVGDLIINQKVISITEITHTKQYDGTVTANIDPASVLLGGILSGDIYIHVDGISAVYIDVNAGTDKINITNINLGGESSVNYIITMPVNSFTVNGGITKADGADVNSGYTFEINRNNREIIITGVTLSHNGQTAEYALSLMPYNPAPSEAWGDNSTISVTETGELFIVQVRAKENANYNAGTHEIITELAFYDVVFESNGGTSVPSQILYVTDVPLHTVNKAVKPADPTRTGFEFAGWYIDSAFTIEWNFETAVISNMTLRARWLAEQDIQIDVDEISDGNINTDITTDVVLSRSNGAPRTITIDGENISSVEWYYAGVQITGSAISNNGRTITLQVSDNPSSAAYSAPYNIAGKQLLTVVVTVNGVPYSRRIEFEVAL